MTETAIKITDLLLRPEFAPKVLDGTKSMTRRIIKPQPTEKPTGGFRWGELGSKQRRPTNGPRFCVGGSAISIGELIGEYCPYGQPGNRLRFLTTWAVEPKWDRHKPTDLPRHVTAWTAFDNGTKPRQGIGKKRPGRFMPLWMRNWLPVFELTEVRVERINSISRCDITKEGCQECGTADGWHWFKTLWNAVNGPGAWKRNDWCWVLAFRKVEDAE